MIPGSEHLVSSVTDGEPVTQREFQQFITDQRDRHNENSSDNKELANQIKELTTAVTTMSTTVTAQINHANVELAIVKTRVASIINIILPTVLSISALLVGVFLGKMGF